MKLAPVFAKFSLLIFGLVIFYFLGVGLVNQPWEGDSLAYHLPLAEKISEWQFSHYDNLLFYYPATVHVLLAGFNLVRLPWQWFNVFGIGLLFVSSYWLGRRLLLTKDWAVILAATIALLTPMARLISTQTVDIYLAVIYVLLLALLLKPEAKLHYFVRLGILSGALVGAKYTGPLFLLWLIPMFFWPVYKVSSITRLLVAILLLINVGGIWYLRNWLVMGDPIYPAHHPGFAWVNWQTWQTIVQVPDGWWYFLESLISEYLFWPVLLLALPILALAKKLTPIEQKLTWLGIGNFVIHLLTPASINNVLSDMRYTVPTFICLLAAAFLVIFRQKQHAQFLIACLISILASLSLILPHRPKVYVLYGIVLGGLWLLWQKLPAKLKSKFAS